MKYIFKLKYWREHVKPLLKQVYNINNIYFAFYGNTWIYTNKKNLDLSNPELAKLYSFYEILNGVDNGLEDKITWGTNNGERFFEFFGSMYMGDYLITNDMTGNGDTDKSYIDKEYVYFSYSFEQETNLNLPIPELLPKFGGDYEGMRGSKITYKEFHLLMQIYFGLYQNEELKKELEEKEKNGELKKFERGDEKFFDFWKLRLMRKDITGAFNSLKIEKIFDKDWSEERQKERIEEINEEFGEEVVVLDE